MSRSLLRKLTPPLIASALALVVTCWPTIASGASNHGLRGSKLNNYGDSYRAIKGLNGFVNDVTCRVDGTGALIIAQTFPNGNPNVASRKGIRLAKLTINGHPSTRFGKNGVANLADFRDSSEPVMDASNRILMAGKRRVDGKRMAITRLTAGGRRDRAFGKDGYLRLPGVTPTRGRGTIVTPLADGRIAVGVPTPGAPPSARIFVLTPKGQLDVEFGGKGFIDTGFPVWGLTSASGGRILVSSGTASEWWKSARVLRYNRDGMADQTWGTGGAVSWAALPNSVVDSIQAMFRRHVQPSPPSFPLGTVDFGMRVARELPDGRVVVAINSSVGTTDDNEYFTDFIWTTRLLPDGQTDLTYGTNGASFIQDIENQTEWLDSGDFENYEWELLPSGRVGVWYGLYGFTDEMYGEVYDPEGKGSLSFDLKFLVALDVAFDPERERALLCANYKKRKSVFSLQMK